MKKDNYFIKIKPEFLFDEYNVFESNYTPWVYLAIKQKYNYYLEHAPNKTFTIDKKGLAGYYATSYQTINTAVNELKNAGLLEAIGREYRLIYEQEYLTKFRTIDAVIEKKYPEFIKVYNNDYEDLLLDIKKEILPIGSHERLIIKCLKVYYYLLAYDRHCIVLDKEPILESSLTQTSLETETGIEHRVIKFLLPVLRDIGYINLENRTIYTLNKKTYDPSKHTFQKSEDVCEEEYSTEPTANLVYPYEISHLKTKDGKKVPESFIGYFKTPNGKSIYVIYYSKGAGFITTANWSKGDGIPQTSEEFDIYKDLMMNGKSSQYYNPKNFGIYKYSPESFKKAA